MKKIVFFISLFLLKTNLTISKWYDEILIKSKSEHELLSIKEKLKELNIKTFVKTRYKYAYFMLIKFPEKVNEKEIKIFLKELCINLNIDSIKYSL